MLMYNYSQLSFLFSFFFLFMSVWLIFFKMNFFTLKLKSDTSDKFFVSNNIKKQDIQTLLNYTLVAWFYFFIFLFFFRGENSFCFWNHVKITNFSLYFLYFFLLVLLFLFIFLSFLKNNTEIYSLDYLFSIINLCFFLTLFFFSNTFFFFFFLLEVSSCLVFYKFVSSKIWYKSEKIKIVFFKKYLNVLFFQYWATFLSSTLLLFVLLNFLYFFGTTEWSLINNLLNLNFELMYFNKYSSIWFLGFFFLFSLFLKLGFTPVHLYKIEIYKGLPFISIFFYTTYYFLIFFFFFIFVFFNYLNSFFFYFWYVLFIFLILGLIYIVSLLFDVNYIKAFFAYSTVLNSLGFLSVLLSLNVF